MRHLAGFHRSSRHGGSRSLVVRLDDGRLALMKVKGNPQSTRALIGELIGTLLGRRAGAPFPEPLLVRVSFDELSWMAALRNRPWIPGLQFATVFHPEATPLRNPARAAGLTNLHLLPVTALVELWLHNVDLKRDHLLAVPGVNGPRLVAVDHGHIFPSGPAWTEMKLRLSVDRTPDIAALTGLARAAARPFDFAPAVAACEAVGDQELAEMIRAVPAEWGLSRSEAHGVHAFLRQRRDRLAPWAARLHTLWNGRGPSSERRAPG